MLQTEYSPSPEEEFFWSELRSYGRALERDGVSELCLNDNGSAFLRLGGRWEQLEGASEARRRSLANTLSGILGRELTPATPAVEGVLRGLGLRVSVTHSDFARGTKITVRRGGRRVSLGEWIESGAVPADVATWCFDLARSHSEGLLVSGATGSGKTTFLRALLDRLAAESPEYRLATIEEGGRELDYQGENSVAYEATLMTPRETFRVTLRDRPDKVVFGEFRGPEAYEALRAADSGHGALLGTIHASSAPLALVRFADYASESGPMDRFALQRRVAGAVTGVAHFEWSDFHRRPALVEAATVESCSEENGFETRPLWPEGEVDV